MTAVSGRRVAGVARDGDRAHASGISWPTAAFGVLLFLMILAPKSFAHDPDPTHIGIALSVPSLATYSVAVLAMAYAIALRLLFRPEGRHLPLVTIALFLFMGIDLAVVWSGTSEQWAGVLQLGIGYCGWFVGAHLGPRIVASPRSVRQVAFGICAIVAIEAMVCILQRAGLSINSMPAQTAALMGERTNGTLNHPDNLGKVMVILVVLALALLASDDRRTRIVLWVSIVLSVIPLALSEGRANLLAVVMAVVVWAVLSPQRRPLSVRVGVPIAVVIAVLPFLGTFVDRFRADPEGGPRAGLAQVAMEQIGMRPWGTGPNSYVSVVSAYDSVTASGYPVHNTFLLTAAELGIAGAVFFWLPCVVLVLLCIRSRKAPGYPGSFALAVLAALPGLYIVNMTGWAMLRGSLLPLFFLVLGMAYSQVRVGRLVRRDEGLGG